MNTQECLPSESTGIDVDASPRTSRAYFLKNQIQQITSNLNDEDYFHNEQKDTVKGLAIDCEAAENFHPDDWSNAIDDTFILRKAFTRGSALEDHSEKRH